MLWPLITDHWSGRVLRNLNAEQGWRRCSSTKERSCSSKDLFYKSKYWNTITNTKDWRRCSSKRGWNCTSEMLNTALKQIIVKNYEICDKLGEGLLYSPHLFRKVQVVPHFFSGYLKLILWLVAQVGNFWQSVLFAFVGPCLLPMTGWELAG